MFIVSGLSQDQSEPEYKRSAYGYFLRFFMTIPVANRAIPIRSRGYGEGSRCAFVAGHSRAKLRTRTMMNSKIDWRLMSWIFLASEVLSRHSGERLACSQLWCLCSGGVLFFRPVI